MKITIRRALTTALAILFALGAFAIPAFAASTLSWPGDQSVRTFDNTSTFYSNSSGLDFANGKLYVCDNGDAAVWVLDVAKNGTMTMSSLTSSGPKNISYKDGSGRPDAEGIAVDGDGYIYLAAERDNSVSGSRNTILKVNINTSGTNIPAIQEWDLNSTLPSVGSNKGIESIEFVPFDELEGKLFDTSKNAALKSSDYPNAVAGGVFFVGLEKNGHVYAYILYSNGSFTQIADLDPGMGKVMSLHYDADDDMLWAKADDGCSNTSALLVFNGTQNPDVTFVNPPSGLDSTLNYEGFAIASADYAVNGKRPVYFLRDDSSSGSLSIGSINYPTQLLETYTLTFDPDGGTACRSLTAIEGSSVTLPTTSKNGYDFLGWSDGVNTYGAGTSYTVIGNVTLTAIWREIVVERFTVSFDTDGGTACTPVSGTYGTTITLPSTSKEGCSFICWTDGTYFYPEGGVFVIDSDITLTALWEQVAVPSDDIDLAKVSAYDVKLTGLDPTLSYVIRYATGEYADASAVKKGLNAGFVQVSGVSEAVITLPTHGLHTISAQVGSEQKFIGTVSIDVEDMMKEVEIYIDDLNLRVLNLYGATRVNLLDRYGNIVMKINPTSFTTDGLKTWADVELPASDRYVLRVIFGNEYIETPFDAVVPAASVSTNGRIFTLANYGVNNVNYIRFAKGTITTAAEMKTASDLRIFGRKYFTGDTASFAALDAVNGTSTTYTVQVGYASGYSEFITFDITPTVPVITTTSDSITLSNVQTNDYYIDWVRCAPGELSSLYAIRHANGSQVKKTEHIVNGTITFTGLSAGTYTLYYLYDGWNLSEGMVTVIVN